METITLLRNGCDALGREIVRVPRLSVVNDHTA